MPVTSRPSVATFKNLVETASTPKGREVNGRVTKKELKEALKVLPTTAEGVEAARDILDSGAPLNAAATRHLQGFIDANAAPAGPSFGGGVRTFGSADEMRSALKNNPDFAEDVFQAAFGVNRSRSSSSEVIGVTERPDGGFDVEVELVHWRTRALMKSDTVFVSDAGVIAANPGIGGHMSDPVAPSADTSEIEGQFTDVGHARRFAELALESAGVSGLTRSDAVVVGDVTPGPLGSFFVDVKVAHFMNPDEVRADLRLQLDGRGGFVKAFERPVAADPVAPPDPGPSADPVSAMKQKFADTGAIRGLAEAALADVGIGGLTRSDGVQLNDVTTGPMGSFFVHLSVAHFMNASDVRAKVRVQVNHAGEFRGASDVS